MYYLVYEVKNKLNGKIYVGYHKTNDLDDGYMGSGKHIKAVINKYGVEKFEKRIIKFCSSEEEMKKVEIEIANEEFIKRQDTYNLKVGGHGGFRKGFVSLHGKQVTIEDFNSSNVYKGVCDGKIAVFDGTGKTFQVDKNDKRLLSGELTRCFEKNGLISVIDEHGNKVRVTKEYFNTGNFTSIHKGLISVRDHDGKVFKVKANDKRYLTGELVAATKGKNFNNTEYKIYDNNDILKHHILNEDFKNFCKINQLPYGVLTKSYKTNGKKIYQKLGSNKKRIEASGLLKYVNWYCVKIR